MKLSIELVPKTCWFSNVRSAVTKQQWDYIRSLISDKAWSVCEICGGVGPKHPVECHEIWHYDDKNQIQKLTGMIALCPDCHGVKHFGFSQLQGKAEKAIKHFMKVNKIGQAEAESIIFKAFKTWEQRSQKQWTLDISHLKEYGIDVDKILEK